MLTPEASQGVGDNDIIVFHAHQMAEVSKPSYVAPTNSMSPEKCERGKLPREAFESRGKFLRTARLRGLTVSRGAGSWRVRFKERAVPRRMTNAVIARPSTRLRTSLGDLALASRVNRAMY